MVSRPRVGEVPRRVHADKLAPLSPLIAGSEAADARLRDVLGSVQRRLASYASHTHPEASQLPPLLAQLQLCTTLREGAGVLADLFTRTSGVDDACAAWLLDRVGVVSAHRATHARLLHHARESPMGEHGAPRHHEQHLHQEQSPATNPQALERWLEWRRQRLAQQLVGYQRLGLRRAEPLIALHCAMLREMSSASHAEQLDVLVDAVQRACRDGDHHQATVLIGRAAEVSHGLSLAIEPALDEHSQAESGSGLSQGGERLGVGKRAASHTWACQWHEARLLWEAGGEHRNDAVLVGKRLRDELDAAAHSIDRMGPAHPSSQTPVSSANVAGHCSREAADLRVRLLTTLGGWIEALRCESRSTIEHDWLERAVNCAEAVGDQAMGEALYGMGGFHERQFEALRDEAATSAFEKLVSVQEDTHEELRRLERELNILAAASNDAAKRKRDKLQARKRELEVLLSSDSMREASERDRVGHLENALNSYLLCLGRAAPNSHTSRAAACAVVRLWMRNRNHLSLSTRMSDAISQGQIGPSAFLPLSFQLVARVSGVPPFEPLECDETLSQLSAAHAGPTGTQLDDETSHLDGEIAELEDEMSSSVSPSVRSSGATSLDAATEFQRVLGELIVCMCTAEGVHDTEQRMVHHLLAVCYEDGAHEGERMHAGEAMHSSSMERRRAREARARRQAARTLLQRVSDQQAQA